MTIGCLGKNIFQHNIGRRDEPLFVEDVCWRAFAAAYGIAERTFERWRSDFKYRRINREVAEDERKRSHFKIDAMIKVFEDRGIEFDSDQLASIYASNSPKSLCCYRWMSDFFNLAAESQPNAAGDVQLDWDQKTSFYKQYIKRMEELGNEVVSSRSFYRMWKALFRHVKIRKYKNVGGMLIT